MCNTGPRCAADWLFSHRFSFGVTGVSLGKKPYQKADNREHCRGDCDKIGWSDIANKVLGGVRADDRSDRSTNGDEGIKPFALLDSEKISHECPEDRRVEKVEDAHPHIECPASPDLLCRRTGSH